MSRINRDVPNDKGAGNMNMNVYDVAALVAVCGLVGFAIHKGYSVWVWTPKGGAGMKPPSRRGRK